MFTIYANDELIYTPGDQELLVLQPKLTLEMGAAGSLDFSVPPGHPYYNQFKQISTVVYAVYDGTEIFRGRVLSSSRDFYNFRQTYCEGALSYLVDSVQKGEKYDGTAHGLFRQIITNHNNLVDAAKRFVVGNITVPDKEIKIAGKSTGSEEDPDEYAADYWRQIYIDSVADNWSTTLDYLNTCLIDYLGGYLMVRRVGNTNYIDWVQDYATTASQEIEFGTNLLDLTEEISADDLFTVLIPIGDENLTIASVNGGSIEIEDSQLVSQYGRIVRTEVFGSVNQASTLLENGQNYLAKESSAPITFTIKAVDLSMIDDSITAIRLGDRVKIKSVPHNVNQYYTCTKIEYDLEKPENTVFTFGNPRQSLTQRYRKDKRVEQERAGYQGYSGAGGLASGLGNAITNPTTGDTKKKLDEFFDAWINVSPEQGKIDLGAVYRKLQGTRTVLENNVGINLDAPQGTINIFSDHTKYENDRATLKNRVGIDLDSPAGTINIYSDHTKYENDRATLKNRVGIDLDSPAGTINIYSDHTQYENDRTTLKNRVGIDLDSPGGTINIFADHTQWESDRQTLYNNLGVDLDAPAGTIDIYSTTTNFNNRIDAEETATAQIKLWAGVDEYGNIGSRIALNADLVAVSNRLTAVEGIFDSVTANRIYASRTIASGSSFYAPSFVVADTTGGSNEVNLANHKHSLYCDSNGNVSMGLPVPPNSAVGFNIAGTSFYQAGVSARTASAVRYATYSEDGSTDYGHVYVTSRDGNSVYLSLPSNGYTAGYTAGFTAATNAISSVSYATYSEDGSTDFGHINIRFSNGTTKYMSISPNGYNQGYNAGYTAGQNSVSQRTISSVGYETNDNGDTYYNYIWARFSDGNSQGFIPITNAYNIGRNSVDTNSYYNNGYSAGQNYGFSRGGYRTIYLGSNYGAGAYVSGYYYQNVDSTYMTRQEGSSVFNAEYAVLYFY